MNKKTALWGAVLGSVAVVATTVPSAAADTTAVTFALSGGSLAISTQATAAMGDQGSAGTTSVSGSLGDTVVTDNRGTTQGWSAQALTSAFDNGTTTATSVSYSAGVPSAFTGVVTPVPSGNTTLDESTPTEVMAGTVTLGNNSVTWAPTLTINLPASSTAGSYSGTITTSVN